MAMIYSCVAQLHAVDTNANLEQNQALPIKEKPRYQRLLIHLHPISQNFNKPAKKCRA